MTNVLRIKHDTRELEMDRTFAKNSSIVGSAEFEQLRNAMLTFPTYRITTRQIKRNPNKESHRGLTYTFMENYIKTHGPEEYRNTKLAEFYDMRMISQCHSQCKRYPTIKSWFLKNYPEVAEFGMPKTEDTIVKGDEEADAASKLPMTA